VVVGVVVVVVVGLGDPPGEDPVGEDPVPGPVPVTPQVVSAWDRSAASCCWSEDDVAWSVTTLAWSCVI